MEDLLLLIHRMPYPPNKGDKIRSYHLLKHLAQHYRVHLGTFVDDADDWQHVPTVQALCASAHFAPLNPTLARVRSLGALLANRSLSLDYYRDAGMRAWTERTMREHGVKRIVVFSSQMAQYADCWPQARRVVDFCDVDSDKWRQYAEQKSWPMNMLYRHEARQLLAYERKVARECDASLFVSQPEAELFRDLAPESAPKIGFFNNGVDTDYFSPARDYASPYAAGERAIVFTGAMDYWPNVDAVQWFAAEVFPQLRARFADARFYIVGARPSSAVQALAQLPGVVVTGTVPDVRPYIAHGAVAVAPLRIARGIQNKVLEAMAMATPVVVSPQALEGIEAIPGQDLVLAPDAAAFAAAVAALLEKSDGALGRSARAKVEQLYSWPSNLARIEARLECA
ncbi:TIGR03087 family PEP-CTERM/XrtA system glycosyltransferase [Massilia sp. R2A-15]|uniref:TIGR03087 family PEP-CTERM/XrtA system glycosyltransferase n=1 Tax=Massilia sp. R2A-15 TaxID=3064278 RepID=UPI0027361099|nr:TIGR03087 family PEP-CTERM/XrtA system glycosyltransferase [Massilia sp. R2A-15]WLI88907.1 TIGR03087 family PEP-CTERM/XrtA system glycosyltransferase [Massilia sp. R2A-15]